MDLVDPDAPPAGITPRMRMLLDTIAGPESGGRYNVLYGGKTFNDFSDHPNIPVPIPGTDQYSTASGRYQFLAGTWRMEKSKLGLPDFSPGSQDLAAADLATSTYAKATGGRDLETDLGDPMQYVRITKVLHPQWSGLTVANMTGQHGTAPAIDTIPPPAAAAPDSQTAAPSPSTAGNPQLARILMANQLLSLAPKPVAPPNYAAATNGPNAWASVLQQGTPQQNRLATLGAVARLRMLDSGQVNPLLLAAA